METAWASALFGRLQGAKSAPCQAALTWLHSVRLEDGGWGQHPREGMRIPDTAFIIELLPEVALPIDRTAVARTWAQDFQGPVRLSYKAGFYLMTAAGAQDTDPALVEATVQHLLQDQNEDGGYAPWRGHPIGSEPWSTGVVLWGLSKYKELAGREVFARGLEWLQQNQLPDGSWPYHYLDDGTSIALAGGLAAAAALEDLTPCAP